MSLEMLAPSSGHQADPSSSDDQKEAHRRPQLKACWWTEPHSRRETPDPSRGIGDARWHHGGSHDPHHPVVESLPLGDGPRLRCTVLIMTLPEECESAMWTLAHHSNNVGYQGAVLLLALGAIGVVAGVRLLGLRSRGLALGLAGVGMLIWGPAALPDPHRGFGSYAIAALGVAGFVYVILSLHRWRDRFDRPATARGLTRHEHRPRIAGPP